MRILRWMIAILVAIVVSGIIGLIVEDGYVPGAIAFIFGLKNRVTAMVAGVIAVIMYGVLTAALPGDKERNE